MSCGARISSFVTAALVAGVVSIAMAISVTPTAAADSCPASPNLPSADGSQPPNLGVLRVLNDAKAFVEERSARAAPDEKLAIVLDIDETSVSNWVNLAADDFGFFQLGECKLQPKEPCGFDHWISDHDPEPIKPTLELFTMAKAKGLKVFFISARREEQRADTVRNLTAVGYKDWDDLILKQPSDPHAVAEYKTKARVSIEDKQKVRIIANVGDQHSDLAGGHAERTFKVPNPFYFVP